VTYGFGTRASPRTRKPQRSTKPVLGVTFLVQKKVAPTRLSAQRQLPRYLLTYATIEGQRTLCAIPTDIEAATNYGAVAHGASKVDVTHPDTTASMSGMLCAAVRRPDAGPASTEYALSCRHVFDPTGGALPDPTGAEIRVGPTAVARTSAHWGVLVPAPAISFDAALAVVVDRARLYQALPAFLTGVIDAPERLPARLMIHTDRPSPIRADRSHTWRAQDGFAIDYSAIGGAAGPGITRVLHEELIECLPKRAVKAGDSGAPVTDESGRLLVGMHIAGTEKMAAGEVIRAFLIPAYVLLRADNFHGLTGDGWLTLST
jgi:hypothetical protein